MGWDATFAEGLFGAMKGIVAWLLADGPFNTSVPKIQTYIMRGVTYHFGRAVDWYVGPVRINVQEFEKGESRLALINFAAEEDMTLDDLEEFGSEDARLTDVDDRDAEESMGSAILKAADVLDPSGGYREIVDMRHGITTGQEMTFKEIAVALGFKKQAAHQRYHKAMDAIREKLRDTR
jgi:DNA-directed RNA polymerase specialized sigma24 family protein